eukprot:CAMPEP_0183729372 /NCGR_PEP_ID=MMETSP0737-20130205/30072_1 /TAXON_ID=385413 /ORGANISM="Thalassiosira miniscula, Strain CCMP1093" /LENGTH=775 /DNA_ID=CAMNT_0025961531 /DNA_START=28 /DNA_END=2355 /DNA_ORIENTATION=-
MDAKAAPNGGGGGVVKKKRRKRGGGGGGASATQANTANNAKDANGGSNATNSGATATTAGRGGGGGGGKSGSKNKRRGGGGGGGGRGGGGGGSGESSRFGKNASSPLQLPHIKVTLRNVGDVNKHGTIEGVVNSIRSFLEGAFPPMASAEDNESTPYMTAWQMEKEEFDSAKNMFAEVAAAASGSGGGGSGAGTTSAASSSSGRAFSSGWVYEEKPSALPSDRFSRFSLLPSPKTIVTDFMDNKTEKRVTNTSNVNYVVDTAMSQMMAACGKKYLHFVGGRIVLDEESANDVVLAERVRAERTKLAEEKMEKAKAEANAEANAEATGDGSDQPSNGAENATAEKKDGPTSVESVTKGVEKLSTSDNKANAKPQQALNQMPMIRVRILSVTPVKRSKRRGDIGGKVQLAMYPPDPCLLFKEACRDAGKMAAETHLENNAKVAAEEEAKKEIAEKKEEEEKEKETASPEEGKVEAEVEKTTDAKDTNSKPPSPKATVPQIPYYPLLSPAERSRAVARSRVLLHRSIEAMKLHAWAISQNSRDRDHYWEVVESSSQKTWKGRPHPMVGSMMAGTSLRDLVVENEAERASNGGASSKKGRRGFYGNSREDRYDSTIENSEDYKSFMESLRDGSDPTRAAAEKDAAKKGNADVKKEGGGEQPPSPPELDEEGRPLSAIVMHLREKQAESARAKAEAAAAAAKARAAAAAAKEKLRKEKLKLKKEASKKRKKEAARLKKSDRKASSTSSSRPASKGASMPPPGAMLLKKSGAIPPSGFGVP